jgi:tetratricopeptide (TPR) repeat protein
MAASEPRESKREPEADSDLKEIRREVAETHGVATRTNNAVANLAGSLREVLSAKERYERGLNLNSFVAYVLFTVLLGGGFYLLYRSRAGRLVSERDAAIARRDQAVQEQKKDRDLLDRREEAGRKAADFYQLLHDGKRVEAIRRHGEVRGLALSEVERKVFEDGVERARQEIVADGWAQGKAAFDTQNWKRATSELKLALSYEEEGPESAKMRYFYGVALHKLGDYQEAAKQLDLAIGGGAERTAGADARFYLASALEMLRQLDRARTEYIRFAEGHPQHNLYWTARRKANEIAERTKTE